MEAATHLKYTASLVSLFTGLWGLYYLYQQNKKKSKWVHVGYLDEIFIYPIKGGKGKSVTSAYLGPLGLKSGLLRDREFMIVDKNNTAVGNYQIPKLVLLDVNVERGTYILSHPEATEELFIKHHDMMFDSDRIIETKIVEASMKLLHLGKSYDTWIQNLFGEEDLKLVYHYSSQPLRPVREKFTPIYPESFSAKDFVMCAFTSQATLITWASIDDVNTKLTEPKNHLRYRCNFTARTLDDEPYQEDHWKNFRIGTESLLHTNKTCHKCVVVNIDPETGTKDPHGEPLKTLYKFRKYDFGKESPFYELRKKKIIGPPLSINCGFDEYGHVHVGDPILAQT